MGEALLFVDSFVNAKGESKKKRILQKQTNPPNAALLLQLHSNVVVEESTTTRLSGYTAFSQHLGRVYGRKSLSVKEQRPEVKKATNRRHGRSTTR
jgi:hypothetical protein